MVVCMKMQEMLDYYNSMKVKTLANWMQAIGNGDMQEAHRCRIEHDNIRDSIVIVTLEMDAIKRG